LINGVDAVGKYAGALKDTAGREYRVRGVFGGDCALVAVTERLAQGLPVWGKPDIVHGPAVDGNGSDAFWRPIRSLAKTFVEPGKNCIEGPVERQAAMDRTVGNTMDDLDLWPSIFPAKQGDTAAFGA
jgi:hypothetical protein